MRCDWSMRQNLKTWGEFWINQVHMVQCRRKVVSGRKVTGITRFLVNARGLHEALLMLILLYGYETMMWRKAKFRIRAIQMDNLRGVLDIRRMDSVPNAWITELCGVDEKIDGHIEKIARRVYVRECAGSGSVGRPRKRWIDTVNDCLK